MKVYKTKKLFYGKWLYKIETKTPGASLIKHWGFEKVKSVCEKGSPRLFGRSFGPDEKQSLLEYITAIQPYFGSDLKTRVEYDRLDYFVNDVKLYKELSTILEKWVVSITEPDSETDIESLQAKASTVLCNQLPHNKYRYKVYIRSGMPVHQRQQFKIWLENYGDKVQYSKSTTEWLDGKTYYSQCPFIYVEDQGLLLMAKMYLGNWAQKTHEFVIRDTQKSS